MCRQAVVGVTADRRPAPVKQQYALVLGRFNAGRGQDLAAQLAHKSDVDLVYHRPEQLDDADPQNPDVQF